jgi:cellulose synthase/poly-beta-1,6-N-acetylglucosamine synthase-like glycosyltransferase
VKPYAIQRVLAHGVEIATIGGGLVLGTAVAFFSKAFSLWAVFAVLAALPLGAIFGMLVVYPVILVICHFLNGAPFHPGDMVHILKGQHRGRVVRVYDVWGEQGQVRVELGAQEKTDVKDVFE